jgi:hypothetical protein
VNVHFGEEDHRVAVVDGYYLFTAWDVPEVAVSLPRVTSHHF